MQRGMTEGTLANLLGSHLDDPAELFSKPIVDPAAMTVAWHGRTCKLGHCGTTKASGWRI